VSPSHPIVVCPLEHERRMLERHGVGRRAALHCCGVGGDAVRRWATAIGEQRGPVVLAGVAGALSTDVRVGEAHVIAEIRAGDEALARPPLGHEGGAVLAAAEAPVLDPAERRQLAASTGAGMVDLESAAFARLADERSWRWGIVRGVSDDGTEGLPPLIAGWIDDRGRVRPGRIAVDLLRRPRLVAPMSRLRRQSAEALAAVARSVLDLLDRCGS
jgi:nucleoside phosphorylase